MATRIRPGKRKGQPQVGIALDRSNPITKALAFAGVMVNGALVDLVSGTRGTPSGTTLPALTNMATGQRGLQYGTATSAATATYTNFGALPGVADIALNGGSIFVWGKFTDAGGFAERNDNNSVNAGWQFGVDSNGFPSFLAEHSSVNFIGRVVTSIFGTASSVAAAFAASPSMAADCAMYIGGQLQTTNLGAQGSGTTGSDSANSLYIGRNSFNSSGINTSGSCTGAMEMVLIWKRQLSAAEVLSLHQNRYQILRQVRRMQVQGPVTGVTVALTGVSSASAVGTLGLTNTLAQTGNSSTSAVGTLGLTDTLALTGNSSTTAVGALAANLTAACTGSSSTGSTGSIAPNIILGLTGNVGTSAVGNVALATAITGNSSTSSTGTLAPGDSVATTGVVSSTSPGSVTGVAVTLALTGVAATGAVGNVSIPSNNVLVGQQGTGSAGNIGPQVIVAVAGVGSALSVGTVLQTTETVALMGAQSNSSVGSTTIGTSIGAGGIAINSLLGGIASGLTVAIHGDAATLRAGNVYSGQPPVLAEQSSTLIITSAVLVDVSRPADSAETSVSL